MGEKIKKFTDSATNKLGSFVSEHPVLACSIFSTVILAAGVPLCVAAYKYAGKVQGKAIAKQLAEAGVKLGYTHD